MKRYSQNAAFTLAELVVVIVIVAILSTIGFVSYTKYLASSRDTNRVAQLNDISDGLQIFALNQRLPDPENAVTLTVDGSDFALQWDIGPQTLQIIEYKWGGKYMDLTYMLSKDKKDFQLMTFVEDPSFVTSSFSSSFWEITSSAFAQEEEKGEYPLLIGKPLWIVLWKASETPIQRIPTIMSEGVMDVSDPPIPVISYVYGNSSIDSSTENLLYMIPNSSCLRIKQYGKSKWDGMYVISPNGHDIMNVYCDMTIDGWGYMLVARSVMDYEGSDVKFWWNIKRWEANDDSQPYSMGLQVQNIDFSEILYTTYTEGKKPDMILKLYDIDINIIKQNMSDFFTEDCIAVNPTDNYICDGARPEFRFWGNIPNELRYELTWKPFRNGGLHYNNFRGNSYPNVLILKTWMIFVR